MAINKKHATPLVIITIVAGALLSGCRLLPLEVETLYLAQGTWEQEGTGYILNINQKNVTFYHSSRQTCSQSEHYETIPDADKDITKAQLEEKQGLTWLSIVPSGGTEADRLFLREINELPTVCQQAPNPDTFDPVFIFDHVWHVFNDYYPFFSLRDIDWNSQYDIYKPQVSSATTQEQLFLILAKMLSPIDDGHIELFTDNDELEADFSPANIQGWAIPAEIIAEENDIDTDDAEQLLIEKFNLQLEEYYASEAFNTIEDLDGNNILSWTILENNTGYLQINSMDGFDNQSHAPSQDTQITNTIDELKALNKHLDKVFETLGNTTSLVVDIRFNGGGFDQAALAIAGRFTNERYLSHKKQRYNRGTPTELVEYYVEPHSNDGYTNPTILIAGPNTASAAEIFALAMRPLSHVTHIGQATQGILSDVLSIDLGANWNVGLSHEIYYSPTNDLFESSGIPVDKPVPATSLYGLLENIFPALNLALNKLGTDISLTQAEFEQEINTLMQDNGLPGVVVGWIDNHQILSLNAFGYADIDEGIVATTETPFKVASISQTIIGVSAAQMLENEYIELDTTLEEAGIDITINTPYGNSSDISLRHLVTHTSGISDGDNYQCSYYLNEDISSFANTFDLHSCPEPVTNDQQEFLRSFLNSDGNLYNADNNFLSAEAGDTYEYSNVSTALAAEALAAASGTNLKQWTEQAIFTPLGMQNTYWNHQNTESSNVQPATHYVLADNNLEVLPAYSLATWSIGDLHSSIHDLARYLLAISRGGSLDGVEVLTTDSIINMLSPQTEIPILKGSQGIFWINDGFLFGHSSSDFGVMANMQFDQHSQLGVITLTNVSGFEDTDKETVIAAWEELNQLVYRRGLGLKAEQ